MRWTKAAIPYGAEDGSGGGEVRYLLMLVLSLAVLGAMSLTLTVFFRRLKRIERERWGDRPENPE